MTLGMLPEVMVNDLSEKKIIYKVRGRVTYLLCKREDLGSVPV